MLYNKHWLFVVPYIFRGTHANMPYFYLLKSTTSQTSSMAVKIGQNSPILYRGGVMTKEPVILALIAKRKSFYISQTKAASMAGLSLKTYQRIEKGTADIRLKNFKALLKGLKTTDLDISLDALGFSDVTAWDVAAASRLLPPDARAALVEMIMIMIIYRDKLED